MDSVWFRRVVPAVLVLLGVGGLWLLFTGGDDGTTATHGDSPRLEIAGTDTQEVASLAGLGLPEGTEDFLTARLEDDSQLDVTFTVDPSTEAAFLEASELAQPVADERVIYHSSPLWKLNVEGTIRGTSDVRGGVSRSVELVPEDDRTRVRVVITPAG